MCVLCVESRLQAKLRLRFTDNTQCVRNFRVVALSGKSSLMSWGGIVHCICGSVPALGRGRDAVI